MHQNHKSQKPHYFSIVRMVFPAIWLLKAISNLQPKIPAIGVCLEGDTTLRLRTTAELYQARRIDRIIVSGGVNEPELDRLPAVIMKQRLIGMGIPEEVIDLEKESKNTRDHALFVGNLARNQGYNEMIIITSGYHLLRAYLTILKEVLAQDHPFSLYGYPAGSTLTWLARSPTEGKYRFLLFVDELVKIRKYKNDVASFEEAWRYVRLMNIK